MKFVKYLVNLIRINSGDSSKSFLLVTVGFTCVFLLLVVGICMLWDVFTNGHLKTDLTGLAAYIASVAGLVASVLVPKVWGERSENKREKDDKGI